MFHSLSEEDSDNSLDDSKSKDEESMDETVTGFHESCCIDLNNVPVKLPQL